MDTITNPATNRYKNYSGPASTSSIRQVFAGAAALELKVLCDSFEVCVGFGILMTILAGLSYLVPVVTKVRRMLTQKWDSTSLVDASLVHPTLYTKLTIILAFKFEEQFLKQSI